MLFIDLLLCARPCLSAWGYTVVNKIDKTSALRVYLMALNPYKTLANTCCYYSHHKMRIQRRGDIRQLVKATQAVKWQGQHCLQGYHGVSTSA